MTGRNNQLKQKSNIQESEYGLTSKSSHGTERADKRIKEVV
jgi:hypothetical protein